MKETINVPKNCQLSAYFYKEKWVMKYLLNKIDFVNMFVHYRIILYENIFKVFTRFTNQNLLESILTLVYW